MWALHESYDPHSRLLHLELVAAPCAPDFPPELPTPTLLGTFREFDDARTFTGQYLEAVSRDADRIVSDVIGPGAGKACRLLSRESRLTVYKEAGG